MFSCSTVVQHLTTSLQTTSLPRIDPVQARLIPELDPTHAVGRGILNRAERTTDPALAERLGWILVTTEGAREFLQLAQEFRTRSNYDCTTIAVDKRPEVTPVPMEVDQADALGAAGTSPRDSAAQQPTGAASSAPISTGQAQPARISYLQGIALKERGVILHGLAALARRHDIPEKTRDGLNSSRREKLLGLIALLLRTEERGQVLKSSYGTLAAKLETSESTVKDLLSKVPALGLYTMRFDSRAQMWEIRSGPTLTPQAWTDLLKEGQRELEKQIARNTKVNITQINDPDLAFTMEQARRYPPRRRYEKAEPDVGARTIHQEPNPTATHPDDLNPGEVHLGSDQQPGKALKAMPGEVRPYHPGEVHLGIKDINNTLDIPTESNTLTTNRVTLDINSVMVSESLHYVMSSDRPGEGIQVQPSLAGDVCTDGPGYSDRSLRSLTPNPGIDNMQNSDLTPLRKLDYGSVIRVKGYEGLYVIKGMSWGDTADNDSVRCVSLDNPSDWLECKQRDIAAAD